MDNLDLICDICGEILPEHYVVYETDKGENFEVCDLCRKHIDNLLNEKDKKILEPSIEYFNRYLYIQKIKSKVVADYVKSIIENPNSHLPKDKQKVQNNTSQDYVYQSNDKQKTSSGWIKGMRIFAWIAFCAIIIIGIVISVPFWDNSPFIGVVSVLGGFVTAFLSVAFIMIFLDIAEDIKAIRNNTENNKKP
ncbi:MAG: hypothetical protein FWD71_13710 [Oscillospiraceae bacterium]|nr:hypothetical protein [Oscillospiraceae bacterium]